MNTAEFQILGRGKRPVILAIAAMMLIVTVGTCLAEVPAGSAQSATNYYSYLAKTLGFSTPAQIFQTTLDDVTIYLGYGGITGADLQNLPSAVLMNPDQLISSVQHPELVAAQTGAIPFRPDDILVTRFFAPKIMNIKEPEVTRLVGWRKLVRLKARPGSPAQAHNIASGIILFNLFSQPGAKPFQQGDESVNTQVMLVTETSHVPPPNAPGPDEIYWLDFDRLSNGGALSLALHNSFDANELPQSRDGLKAYFVPDGCVACHGINARRSMVNYLDTDHWFDRIETDFTNLKNSELPLLVDAHTNDTSSFAYALAFDVIRRFNVEADEEVQKAQPAHDEAKASKKWLQIHASTNVHISPLDRAIGPEPLWSGQNPNDARVLAAMNQYCFRCHGTVKFSIFNKQMVLRPDILAMIEQAIKTNAPLGIKMPPDREMPEETRALIVNFINK